MMTASPFDRMNFHILHDWTAAVMALYHRGARAVSVSNMIEYSALAHPA